MYLETDITLTVKSVYIPEQEEQYSAIAREAQILIQQKFAFKGPLHVMNSKIMHGKNHYLGHN